MRPGPRHSRRRRRAAGRSLGAVAVPCLLAAGTAAVVLALRHSHSAAGIPALFSQAAPGARWLEIFKPYVTAAPAHLPPAAGPGGGYAAAVSPGTSAALGVAPGRLPAATAASLDGSTANVPAGAADSPQLIAAASGPTVTRPARDEARHRGLSARRPGGGRDLALGLFTAGSRFCPLASQDVTMVPWTS